MITFKVGILGAGHIAGVVAECLNELSGFSPYAVAAREAERATAFAAEHHIEKSYGSYEELVKDPDVELVYIATVNSNHAELARLCLENGKPCLVEKPFSYNRATTEEILNLAKEKNLYCGEALWTRYMPLTLKFQELIRNNVIGPVRHVTANIGYDLHDKERLIRPELAGGALLDIGVYPISMVFSAMGQLPATFAPAIVKWNTGVDAIISLQMNFAKARSASVLISMTYKSDNSMTVYGTTGRIVIDNVNCPEKITVYGPAGEETQILKKSEKQASGYEFQFLSAREAIMTGKIESPEHSAQNILQLASFLETIRRSGKIVFPLPGEPTLEEVENQFKKTNA